MKDLLDRRPLGWLLLGVFAALYACRSLVGAVEAGFEGDGVIVFWRTVELVFFATLAVASIQRTSVASVGDRP